MAAMSHRNHPGQAEGCGRRNKILCHTRETCACQTRMQAAGNEASARQR
jgi:hypothetical protein